VTDDLDTTAAEYNLGARQGRTFPRERGGFFARFEHGDVYRHPTHGIWAIPDPIRGEWGKYGYEMHWLGYPRGAFDGSVQAFEHGWVVVNNGAAFAMWVDPEIAGMATASAVGLPSGWIIQLTETHKVARSPQGAITFYGRDELSPPEIAYRDRPTYFPTYAEQSEQWAHPPIPEPDPEPEFPDGLDYDPDDIPEY